MKTRHGLSQFFCLRRWSASWGKLVASFVFAVFNDFKGFLTSNNAQGLKLPFALAQDVCLQDIEKNKVFVFIVVRG